MSRNDLRDALGADDQGRVMAAEKGRRPILTTPKRRAKKEGHDELIARLAPVGTEITLMLKSGEVIEGRLTGSDRFTITLSDINEETEGGGIWNTTPESPVVIFYKHSIDAFRLKIIGDKSANRG